MNASISPKGIAVPKLTLRLTALAVLLSLLALPAPAAMAGAEAPPLYLNAGEARPVYESADVDAQVLRQLMPSEAFELRSSQGGWAGIRVFNETGEMIPGWVSSDGLRPKTQADGYSSAVIAPLDPGERPVLRAQPRSNAASLGRYYPGVVARVLAQPDKDWVRLGIGSLEGYMKAEDLAFDPLTGSIADLLPRVSVAYQDGPSLTMRGAQSFKSEKIGAYRNGTQVRVLGFTDDFAQVVAPDGRLGFMMAWGLNPQPFAAATAAPMPLPGAPTQPAASQPPALVPPASYAYTTTVANTGGQGAHLRAKSSQNAPTQGMYPNGTQVYVLKYGEYWCNVWVDGKTGWMMTKLLQGTNQP